MCLETPFQKGQAYGNHFTARITLEVLSASFEMTVYVEEQFYKDYTILDSCRNSVRYCSSEMELPVAWAKDPID